MKSRSNDLEIPLMSVSDSDTESLALSMWLPSSDDEDFYGDLKFSKICYITPDS